MVMAMNTKEKGKEEEKGKRKERAKVGSQFLESLLLAVIFLKQLEQLTYFKNQKWIEWIGHRPAYKGDSSLTPRVS